jgi:hypothetical protein
VPTLGGTTGILAATLTLSAVAALAACGRTASPAGEHAAASAPGAISGAVGSRSRAYAVALEQATGAHRVALERCAAMSGAARADCRADAERRLAQTREQAAEARDDAATGTPAP